MAGGKLGPARFAGGVGPCGASTISTRQAGFTGGPRGGSVSIWEHFVLQAVLQPLYEQLALAAEDLPIKAAAATATASRSPAPGRPRRPAPRRPDRSATGTDPGGEGSVPGAARGQSPVTTN